MKGNSFNLGATMGNFFWQQAKCFICQMIFMHIIECSCCQMKLYLQREAKIHTDSERTHASVNILAIAQYQWTYMHQTLCILMMTIRNSKGCKDENKKKEIKNPPTAEYSGSVWTLINGRPTQTHNTVSSNALSTEVLCNHNAEAVFKQKVI